jgi:basic amino acid/polyamine antiporter, APA family
MSQSPAQNPPRHQLRRSLGLFEVTMSGVGLILGAGIYVLIGPASGFAGNMLWLAFLLSAVIALFTGLSYAELSSMFPKAGAEYDYVRHAFSLPGLAFVIGWLIFLSGVLAAATVALGFAGYFFVLTGVQPLISASVLIVILAVILAFGVKETAWVIIISTIIEVLGLLIVIWIGLPHLGAVNYFELPHGLPGLFAASALIFFAYQGFESMVKFSEETKNPETTIPKALLLSLAISVILYVLVALAVISVMGWQTLSVSKAPFSDLVTGILGPRAAVGIAVIALFATANTSLMSMYASSRILYGMSGTSPHAARLGWVHPRTRTPWAAILICGLLSITFIFSGDIGFIAGVTNFTLFVTFIVINGAVIALRFNSPEIPRPFRIPFSLGNLPIIPLAGLLFCILLLANQDRAVLALGAGLTIGGVVIYTFTRSRPRAQ